MEGYYWSKINISLKKHIKKKTFQKKPGKKQLMVIWRLRINIKCEYTSFNC